MDSEPLNGACHCGAVRFRVRLKEGLDRPIRCNCSLCRMRGAVVVMADLAGLDVHTGEDVLSVYRFNTEAARHYFCSRCGVYTHHQRRLDPSQYAVNAACLEGVSPFDFEEASVVDGVNHPLDQPGGGGLRQIGVLKFVRSD